jgi:hypothetical protein
MTEIKKLIIRGSIEPSDDKAKSDKNSQFDTEDIDSILEEFKLNLMEELDKKIQNAIKKTNKR